MAHDADALDSGFRVLAIGAGGLVPTGTSPHGTCSRSCFLVGLWQRSRMDIRRVGRHPRRGACCGAALTRAASSQGNHSPATRWLAAMGPAPCNIPYSCPSRGCSFALILCNPLFDRVRSSLELRDGGRHRLACSSRSSSQYSPSSSCPGTWTDRTVAGVRPPTARSSSWSTGAGLAGHRPSGPPECSAVHLLQVLTMRNCNPRTPEPRLSLSKMDDAGCHGRHLDRGRTAQR